MDSAPPNITLLASRGRLLAKKVTVGQDGTFIVEPHEKATHFEITPGRVETPKQMHALLKRLRDEPRMMLLADIPDPGTPNPDGLRNGDKFLAEREWLALDSDEVEADEGVDPCSPEAAECVWDKLRPPLQSADCVIQFSGGAGFKGRKIRTRFWFKLDRPMARSRLKYWAELANKLTPGVIDTAMFHVVQPHLTADPVLSPGIADPFAEYDRLLPLHKGPHTLVSVDEIEADIAAMEAEITAKDAAAAPTRGNGSGAPSGGLGTWNAPACGWTGKSEDYLRDKPAGMGLHDGVNRLVWEAAPRLGPNPGKDELKGLASGIREAALSALSAGRLTGRTRDYILTETALDAVSRSYSGAVARGAALRTLENAATGADAALKDAKNAASGKPRVPGYAPIEWLHHAVRLMLSRLGPMTPAELLAYAEARTGIKPHAATREMVQRYWDEHRAAYRRDHRLESPHHEVQRIENLEDVETRPGTVVAAKAGHGTGKTKIIGAKALSEAWAGGAVIVTYRQTLEASIAGRLSTGSYRHRGAAFKAACGVDGLSSMVIDSGAHRGDLQQALHDADLIMVDEAEQTMRHLASEHTRKRLPWLLPVLAETFGQKHKTIVLLDAGLDARTVLGWAALTPAKPIHVYEKPVAPRGVLNLHRETGAKNTRSAVLADALEALERGDRPVIATDTQKGAVALAEALTGRGYSVGLVTGRRQDEQTKRAFAAAPNEYPQEQGWDALIYSPAIAAGVSLESGYFTAVIGLYNGVVSPADFLQQLFRGRTVTEYTVAIVSRGSPAPLPERDRGAAFERLAGEELDDVSRLLLRIDAANARDLQAYGVKFCAAAEDAGLRIERIGGDADLEPLALELREISGAIRERTVAEVLSAPVLDRAENDRLKERRKRGETLSAAESLSMDRGQCCELLGLEEPEVLSADDVEFVQKHHNVNEIIQLFALTVALMLEPGREIPDAFNDPDMRPLALRRYLLPKARVFADLLRGLGVDPVTGRGIWKLEAAAAALDSIKSDHPDTLTAMGLRPEKWGARVAETVRGLLGRIGLRVRRCRPRRDRDYQILPDSWRRLLLYAIRTERLAEVEGRNSPFPDESTFEYDEENDLMIDPLPGWVREGLRNAGLVLADRSWIERTFGVSRRTAFSRKAELAGIDATGVRWFRAEVDDGRTVTGCTDHADLDRLGQDLPRTLGAGWVGCGWIRPSQGYAKNGHLRQSCLNKNVSSDQNLHTPTTETERPASNPDPGLPNAPRAQENAPTAPAVASGGSTRLQNRRGLLLSRWGDPKRISALLKTGTLVPSAPIATRTRVLSPSNPSEVHA